MLEKICLNTTMEISASYIHEFYNSNLGRIVNRQTRGHLSNIIPNHSHEKICGLGFTSPYISHISNLLPNSNIIEMFPDFLGAIIDEKKNYKQKAVHEYFLPIEPGTIDIMILSHLLELVEKPQSVIEEAWRILKPNGILISIVPRRAGLWTRYDNNPFGFGRSFSKKQLRHLLNSHFYNEKNHSYLFTPPWSNYLNVNFYKTWEKIGPFTIPFWGGLMIDVSKKIIYAKNKDKKIALRVKTGYAHV